MLMSAINKLTCMQISWCTIAFSNTLNYLLKMKEKSKSEFLKMLTVDFAISWKPSDQVLFCSHLQWWSSWKQFVGSNAHGRGESRSVLSIDTQELLHFKPMWPHPHTFFILRRLEFILAFTNSNTFFLWGNAETSFDCWFVWLTDIDKSISSNQNKLVSQLNNYLMSKLPGHWNFLCWFIKIETALQIQ